MVLTEEEKRIRHRIAVAKYKAKHPGMNSRYANAWYHKNKESISERRKARYQQKKLEKQQEQQVQASG